MHLHECRTVARKDVIVLRHVRTVAMRQCGLELARSRLKATTPDVENVVTIPFPPDASVHHCRFAEIFGA